MHVLRPWVTAYLTLQMQGTILTAIRGPDNEAKESPSKPVVRAYRCVILNNARNFEPGDTFMGDGSGKILEDDWHAFFSSIDQYPFHWFMHFIHSAEIVGNFHPNTDIADHWLSFYLGCCGALHLNPETKKQLQFRLVGNGHVDDAEKPCKICGHDKTFGPGWGRCANCLDLRYDLEDE